MDYFLDYVCDNFLDLFFWIILLEGNRSLVLREGEMQSISTQGGVEVNCVTEGGVENY